MNFIKRRCDSIIVVQWKNFLGQGYTVGLAGVSLKSQWIIAL
jgi:hypothetical protein